MNRYHIRWLIRRDMPEVLAIENGSWTHPWSEDTFVKLLGQRDCVGMVAEVGEKVVGFIVYVLRKNHVEIHNLAVSPEYRHLQAGSALINKLMSKLSSHRRSSAKISTRESNLAGHLFLRKMGFLAVRVERKYYADTGEDCYEFEYTFPVECEVS